MLKRKRLKLLNLKYEWGISQWITCSCLSYQKTILKKKKHKTNAQYISHGNFPAVSPVKCTAEDSLTAHPISALQQTPLNTNKAMGGQGLNSSHGHAGWSCSWPRCPCASDPTCTPHPHSAASLFPPCHLHPSDPGAACPLHWPQETVLGWGISFQTVLREQEGKLFGGSCWWTLPSATPLFISQ